MRIPTPLVDKIYSTINFDATFTSFTQINKQKLFIKSLELWLFIFDRHCNDLKAIDSNYYTNIHNEELKRFRIKIGGNDYRYKTFINILETASLLKINNEYSNYNDNKYPKSYRPLFDFTNDLNTTEIEIDFAKVFQNTKDKSFWLDKYPQYAHLIEDCYRTKIQLNEYVDFLYNNIGMKLKPIIENGFFKERTLTPNKIMEYILRALKVNLGNIWFGTSEQGRFYHSIASLPSIATDYLLLGDKNVVSIDIPNCQPLLLASIIDCPEYKNDVENGTFYQNLAHTMRLEWNKEIKNKVKLMVMIRFFDNKKIVTGELADALNRLYPNFITQLNCLKENNSIAHLTHKLESTIMVDGVGGLNINKLLKHDEVLIYQENLEKVKRFIEVRINQEYKLNIKIN